MDNRPLLVLTLVCVVAFSTAIALSFVPPSSLTLLPVPESNF
ncbi:MAG TPA: hypothetical protein V6C88_18385 [Chroococcidiopsis sp.]